MKIARIAFGPVWFAMPAVLALWYVGTRVEYPVDFWHCATTGRLMHETGSLVSHDAFTFTIAGEEVLDQAWLARLGMYGLFELGGFELVQFSVGLLYAVALLVVTGLAWHRSGDVRVAAGLGTVALALAASNLTVRTQALSVPLFAVELFVLWRWPGRWWTLGVVAAVELLWTNTHGAFPLGVVLPGIFLAAAGCQRWRAGGRQAVLADRTVRCYLGCVLVALAVMFCNPHPEATLDYVFGVTAKASQRQIGEWAATTSGSWTGIVYFASIIFVLIILRFSKKRPEPIELLLLISFALLGYQAERMVIWWALVMPGVIAPQTAQLVATWKKKPSEQEEPSRATLFIVLALAVMTVMSTPWTRRYNPLLPPSKRQAFSADEPREVVRFLQEAGHRGRVFCTMEWGAYLSWFLDPDIKVFIDSRIDFFPDDVWEDYVHVGTVGDDWEAILEEYEVDLVVWNRQLSEALPTALEQSTNWKNVYADELATVFVRAPDAG